MFYKNCFGVKIGLIFLKTVVLQQGGVRTVLGRSNGGVRTVLWSSNGFEFERLSGDRTAIERHSNGFVKLSVSPFELRSNG